jgi:hypothetical protein
MAARQFEVARAIAVPAERFQNRLQKYGSTLTTNAMSPSLARSMPITQVVSEPGLVENLLVLGRTTSPPAAMIPPLYVLI